VTPPRTIKCHIISKNDTSNNNNANDNSGKLDVTQLEGIMSGNLPVHVALLGSDIAV
jgi:hypothetical protein